MAGHPAPPMEYGARHIGRLVGALGGLDAGQLWRWGERLARLLRGGGRLLAAGNGGSAAQAQHLTAELVGRYRTDRDPVSAIALHAESSTLTAVANDYGYEEVFARQVLAHGRQGDVLLLLSTSGSSPNLLRAARAGHSAGLLVWALTGPVPNALAAACDEAVTVTTADTATVQECHLVAVHLLCAAIDAELGMPGPPADGTCSAAPAERAPAERAPAERAPAERAASARVRPLVVVGDALLDRDVTGLVRRISPEAPVPVVDEARGSWRPGGAGLAAVLAARCVRPVVLVTALARDDHAGRLARLLGDADIQVIDLGLAGPTPVKTRVRADGRTLLMLSEAPAEPGRIRRPLTDEEHSLITGAAAVLVSDYGGGISREASVRAAVEAATGTSPVVWDAHPRGAPPVTGVRLATPSARDAATLVGDAAAEGLAAGIDLGHRLLDAWPVASIAVTRGSQGAVLLDGPNSLPLVVAAPQVGERDSCGAGDCFAVTAANLLAGGALVSEAVVGAVDAASRFVADGGVAEVPPPRPEPTGAAARTRADGGVVVATSGCFDLLHAGHAAMLERARELGDCLIVCLNDDDSVRRLKGDDRPIVPAAARAALLRALAAVDEVVVFGEDTPDRVLREIRPDLYVKGGDYRLEDVLEASLVASWGGRTVLLPYVAHWSTTQVIDKVIQRIRPS